MKASISIRIAASAMFFALAAACAPAGKTPYAEAQKPSANPITYPMVAQGAVSDGHVHEYH